MLRLALTPPHCEGVVAQNVHTFAVPVFDSSDHHVKRGQLAF